MGLPRMGWVGLVVLALASPASADAQLDNARAAVANSDYEAARSALDKALHAGTASPSELAEIYRLTGIVEAALGKATEARTAFARWLELEPKGTLPDGTSPKITKHYKAALAKAKALEAKVETTALPPSITLVVASDDQKLIALTRVIVTVDGTPRQLNGDPGTAITLPYGHKLEVLVQGVDERGNRVFESGSQTEPVVISGADDPNAPKPLPPKPPPPKRVAEPDSPRHWYFEWYAWGGVAVASAAVSSIFLVETRSNMSELDLLNRNSLDHTYAEAQAVESAARRDLVFADLAAGAAGVFALGAVYLYITRPHVAERLPVAVVPKRDGGAIVFGGHF